MTPEYLRGLISGGLPDLFECSPAPKEGVRVRTPMMLPDGDLVDVFVLERDGECIVTDFGDTLGWLWQRSHRSSLTKKQLAMVDDACFTLGVELRDGQLVIRGVPSERVVKAVLRLGQAAMRVADVSFVFPSFHPAPARLAEIDPVAATAYEVETWLKKQRFSSVERNVKRLGGSGRDWQADYEVSAGRQTSLVFLLTAESRGKARRMTEHVLAGCLDLQESKDLQVSESAVSFVSLFDDARGVWREEDFRLVEGVSEVALWSRPDEFHRILAPA